MSTIRRIMALAGAGLLAAGALAAQQPKHALVVGGFGGGYTHFNNLSQPGFATADFKPGFNAGLTAGVELSKLVALHVDLTYARSTGRGSWTGAGKTIDHWFMGAHAELALPMAPNLQWFVFGGGGAVRIDPSAGAGFGSFTTPAGQGGMGVLYAIPRTPMSLMLEGKTLVYGWDRAGYNRTVWDATYSAGLMFRIPWWD
jgi:hypothetical protein